LVEAAGCVRAFWNERGTTDDKVNSTITLRKPNGQLIFILAALAVLSLAYVWKGGARIVKMETQAASKSKFSQSKTHDEAKVVVEIVDASLRKFSGRLLEQKDESHYVRTGESVEASWDKDTKMVMGKGEDVRAGAIVHITGKVTEDHSVAAAQIVILTGYVKVQ
jgi:hypothetical protein